MEKPRKKDEMRAAGKKRLEEFRLRRQLKTGSVKVVENTVDSQDVISDLPLASGSELPMLPVHTEPQGDGTSVGVSQGNNVLEELPASQDSSKMPCKEEVTQAGVSNDLFEREQPESKEALLEVSATSQQHEKVSSAKQSGNLEAQPAANEGSLEKNVAESYDGETLFSSSAAVSGTKVDSEDKFGELTEKLLSMSEEKAHLEKRVEVSAKEADELLQLQEQEDLSVQLQGASTLIHDLQQQNKQIEDGLKTALEERSVLALEKGHHESELSKCKDTMCELRHKNDELNSEVQTLRSQLHMLQEDKVAVTSEFEQRIAKLAEEHNGLIGEAEVLKAKLVTSAGAKSAVDAELESAKEELKEVVGQKVSLTEELGSMKYKLQAVFEENQGLAADFGQEQSQKCNHLMVELDRINQESVEASKELHFCKQSLAEATEVRRRLESDLQMLSIQVDRSESEKAEYSSTLDKLTKDFVALSAEKAHLGEQLRAVEDQLLESRTTSRNLTEDVSRLHSKLEVSDGEVQKLKEENEYLHSELKVLRLDFEGATEERDHLRAETRALEQLNTELRDETLILDRQLQILTQDISQVKAELEGEVKDLQEQLVATNSGHVQQIKALGEEKALIQAEIEAAEKQIQLLNDGHEEAKTMIGALQGQLQETINREEDFCGKFETSRKKMQKLTTDYNAELGRLEAKIKALEEIIQEQDAMNGDKAMLLQEHISKAESRSLELEKAVREVLPLESLAASPSLKSADAGVRLASCVGKLIQEFETKAHNVGQDVQVQTSISAHEPASGAVSVQVTELYSQVTALKESLVSLQQERDAAVNLEQSCRAELEALLCQVVETKEKQAKLEERLEVKGAIAATVTLENSNLEQQLSAIIQESKVIADQMNQLALDKNALTMELECIQKKCREQDDMIQSHVETATRVQGNILALKHDILTKCDEGSSVIALHELSSQSWSEVESSVNDCHDLLRRLFVKYCGVQDGLKQVILSNEDQRLSGTVEKQIHTSQLENDTVAISKCAEQQYVIHDNERIVMKKLICRVLGTLICICDNNYVHSSEKACIADANNEDDLVRLLTQLEESSQALATLSSNDLMQRAELQAQVASLELQVGQLEKLSTVTAAETKAFSDLSILAQKLGMPVTEMTNDLWDADALGLSLDISIDLASNVWRLARQLQNELKMRDGRITDSDFLENAFQDTFAVETMSKQVSAAAGNGKDLQQKLATGEQELERVSTEHSFALQNNQQLKSELDLEKEKTAELAAKLQESASTINRVIEKQSATEIENAKLQSDIVSLQLALRDCKTALIVEETRQTQAQAAFGVFILEEMKNVVQSLLTDTIPEFNAFERLVRGRFFSSEDIDKAQLDDVDGLRREVLLLVSKYKESVKERVERNDEQQKRLENALDQLSQNEMALQSATSRYQESVAYHETEIQRLMQETHTLSRNVLESQNEIDSLKSTVFQTEQKLAATKDKLGLVVSKGKSISNQRETLKQSLAQKATELDLLVIGHREELNEKDAALHEAELRVKQLEAQIAAANLELVSVNASLSTVEHQLLEKLAYDEHMKDSLSTLVFPKELNTNKLSDQVEWVVKAFGDAQKQSDAMAEEFRNGKMVSDLLTLQLKEVQEKENFLLAELETWKQKFERLDRDLEKCIQERSALAEEAARTVSANNGLQEALTLATEKLDAEAARQAVLCSDLQEMLVKAQKVIPGHALQKVLGHETADLSLPSSFGVLASMILGLYIDSMTEVEELKGKVLWLTGQLEQSNADKVLSASLNHQLGNLRQVLEDKDLEIGELTTKLEEAAYTMAHQEEEISALLQQVRNVKQNLEAAVHEKTIVQAQLTEMEQRFSTTREKLGVAVRKGKALRLEHDTMRQNLAGKVAEVDALAASHVRELQAKDSLLEQLHLRLSMLLEEKQAKEDAVSNLGRDAASVQSVTEDRHQLEGEIESLKEALAARKSDFNRAQGRAANLSSEIEALQVSNGKLREQLDNLKVKLSEKQEECAEIGALRTRLKMVMETINSSITELSLLQSRQDIGGEFSVAHHAKDGQPSFYADDVVFRKCESLLGLVHHLAAAEQEKVKVKESELAARGQDAKEAQHEITWLHSEVSALKQQLLAKEEAAMEMREDRDHLQVAIQDIQTLSKKALREKEADCSNLRQRLGQLERAMKDMRNMKEVDEGKVRALEARRAEQEEEIDILHSKLRAANQRADEAAKSIKNSEEKLAALHELLSSKNEDLEAHMQVLCEAESQVDTLSQRVRELEAGVRQKQASLQSLEASRSKAISKLNTNYKKLNEVLHQSEELLALSENLQLDLEKRDIEITRLTEEVEKAHSLVQDLQTINQGRELDQLKGELLGMVSKVGKTLQGSAAKLAPPESSQQLEGAVSDENGCRSAVDELGSLLEALQSEVEGWKASALKKDSQLQDQRVELQLLLAEKVALQGTVQNRDLQIQNLLTENGPASVPEKELPPMEICDLGQRSKRISAIQVANAVAAAHVRGPRKLPLTDVVIDIGQQTLNDIDDKGHDYKSLAMSKYVPRVMRSTAERLDGLWPKGSWTNFSSTLPGVRSKYSAAVKSSVCCPPQARLTQAITKWQMETY